MSFAVKDSVIIYFHENQKFSWVNNNILKLNFLPLLETFTDCEQSLQQSDQKSNW